MKKLNIFFIATQIIYFLTLPLWFFIWLVMFLAIYYEASLQDVLLFAVTSLYPIVAIACSILSWWLSSKHKTRASIVACLIPLLLIVSFFALIHLFNI